MAGIPGCPGWGPFPTARSVPVFSPVPRPSAAPNSGFRAGPRVTIPIPVPILPPAGIPFILPPPIGPTIEVMKFIMWWNMWQWSTQSPGLFATNSMSRAWATADEHVVARDPGRLRDAARLGPGDPEGQPVQVHRVVVDGAEVDQAGCAPARPA